MMRGGLGRERREDKWKRVDERRRVGRDVEREEEGRTGRGLRTMVTCMLIQRKPAVTSRWILWEERGGVHMIILKIVSVCSLQVCAIPHI